ncbi:discoidin domain-containing protein [Azospirillum agricola]|uniref:discoidin domain-containing protein n=1 Tax=Azospirillum agricola TaxID=1720247 RepID=UPI000A0F1507|nr:discoidin domain-containing protein [Azospirillum agricola]SMH59477.1 Glycine rich protein [Azospirillum lipoferum]
MLIGSMMLGGAPSTPRRYLRLAWPGAFNSYQGFNNVRFLINGTAYPPPMTGANTPFPYEVRGLNFMRDFFGGQEEPYVWRAFDDPSANSVWYYPGADANWLQVDFGVGMRVCPDAISITPRSLDPNYPGGIKSPFTLLGSNDGSTFVEMAVVSHPGTAWTPGTSMTLSTGLIGQILAASVVRYGFTGADQVITVPAGVTKGLFYLWGAGGGHGGSTAGGEGGFTVAELSVTPGQSFTLMVGEAGRKNQTRAYPSGGRCGDVNSGGGGGRSQISDGTGIVLIAGGGGGGGWNGNGGRGGGLNGEGVPNSSGGGTQSGGGGTNANYLYGGDTGNSGGGYGGGGDGLYGGGGSGSDSGGGGGSGYVRSGLQGATAIGRAAFHPLTQSGIGTSGNHGQIAVAWL